MSHKLAWAAALLSKHDEASKERYLNVVKRITDALISQQSDEGMIPESINASYNQSAEVAFWLLEIGRILNDQRN